MLDKSVLVNAYSKRDEILHSINKGDINGVRHLFDDDFKRQFMDELDFFKRIKKNPVRLLKNFLLSCNAQYSMAAHKGGMEILIAHRLAERFSLMIEDNDRIETLWKIHTSMLETYGSSLYRKYSNIKLSLADRVDLVIEERFMEEISMDDLAKILHISKEHMMRTYKKERSITINNALKFRRIDEAKSLLRYTNLSYPEIANSLSFSTPQYFATTFKSLVGMTPKEFRRDADLVETH